jgi:membrane protease YdiL (CAAX protease family)
VTGASGARTAWILAATAALYALFRWLDAPPLLPRYGPWLETAEGALKLVLWTLPCALVVRTLGASTYRDAWRRLGLDRGGAGGALMGVAAVLPSAIVYLAGLPTRLDGSEILTTVLLSPIAEETLFRGLLFRQLVLAARWPMAAAALLSAGAFAAAHPGYLMNLPAAMTTIGAGVLFAWLAWRWESLWPSIALHGAMNLSWALFGTGTWALGSFQDVDLTGPGIVNAARATTIGIAIVVTLVRTRRAHVNGEC